MYKIKHDSITPNLFHILQVERFEADLMVEDWTCHGNYFADMNFDKFAHCAFSKSFAPMYIWSRYPLMEEGTLNLSFSVDTPTTFLFIVSMTLTLLL